MKRAVVARSWNVALTMIRGMRLPHVADPGTVGWSDSARCSHDSSSRRSESSRSRQLSPREEPIFLPHGPVASPQGGQGGARLAGHHFLQPEHGRLFHSEHCL